MEMFKRIVSLALTLALLLGCVPMQIFGTETEIPAETQETAVPETTEETLPETTEPEAHQEEDGLTISILGDSISTYQNYSNGTAAETTNSTIAGGAIYYPRSGFSVTAGSTWWYQLAQELGAEVLVNNSWSGSCLLNERYGTVGAYVDRCVQLHDNTGEDAGRLPDIIGIFLGTNDYYTYPGTLGSYEAINFASLIQETEGGCTYAQPTTSLEAYAIILHKISKAYPDAEVYCMTLLPRLNSSSQPTAFNEDLRQLAQRFGVYVVDLYDCGIRSDSAAFYMLMGDTLHPDNEGMDAITNAFLSTFLKNSRYMSSSAAVYDVSWKLENVVAMAGTPKAVLGGRSLNITLKPTGSDKALEVAVTMGGTDITAECYSDGVISIANVTGDLSVSAKAVEKPQEPEAIPEIDRELTNFRWELRENQLVNVTDGQNSVNELTMTHGSISGGTLSGARFALAETIYLNHDQPWTLEWKSSGSWGSDGGLLFAQEATSNVTGARYLFRRAGNTMFAMGYHDNGKYRNYGVEFAGTGIDTTKAHVFRLTNRIGAEGNNVIYLYVDNKEVGPLNRYYVDVTSQNTESNWLSGKNFRFRYLGTQQHPLTSCVIEYIQVSENGNYHSHDYIPVVTKPTTTTGGYTTYTCAGCGDSYVSDYTDPINPKQYRWEVVEDQLVSISGGVYTENVPTMTHGSIAGGKFSKTRFTLSREILLRHDLPWCVEWKSSGTWTDTTDGGLLFAQASASATADTCYFYRRHKNDFFAFGTYTGGQYHNYGVAFAGTGIDTTAEHVFRMENRIADNGSNMVYLFVDDVEVGPMNVHYIGGTLQKNTSDWISGKDFRFSYLGTTPHTIGGCSIEYISVWEAGVVEENLWEGRSAVFVGDSITAGTGTTKIYHQYLKETLGFGSVTAMGVPGSCISAASDYGTGNSPLINRYQNIPSADLIMIFMGTNDYGHETPLGSPGDAGDGTFYGALNTILPALAAKHPDSQIVCVTPLHRYGFGTSKILGTAFTYDNIPNGVGATLGDYVQAIKKVCAQNGIAVIDLHTEFTLDPADAEVRTNYMPDGLRPNAAGHQVVADLMASHILRYAPKTEAPEPEEETELIYGNKFASGYSQQNRASSRKNFYLKAGTVITLKNPELFQWACTKTSNENSTNNLGYFPDSAWTDKKTAVVAADGWVGFVFKYRDDSKVFDLSKPLSDYITIHTHAYRAVVTAPTCTEGGFTTHTCSCGDSYVDTHTEATAHTYVNGTCTGCGDSFAGKTVSILSHSASTYAGVSNDATANSTIGKNDVYYTEGRHGVYREDTWWQQTIDALGMELLVNNSWSGSCVFMPRKGEASVGYGDRAVNLHNDRTGQEPDVIFVYLGCNDFAYYQDTFGKAADIDYTALIRQDETGNYTYQTPETACEAYAIMLHKVHTRYPNAKIYCMTSTARRDPDFGDSYPDVGQPTQFVAQLHQVADTFGFPVVDLEDWIPKEAELFDQYMGDKRAHPNPLGMDQITNAVLSVMLGGKSEIRHVTSADGVVPEQAVLLGGSYHAKPELPEGCTPVVTMGGKDITEEVYRDGRISVDTVTGDIEVSVALREEAWNFRWEMQANKPVSVGQKENELTLLGGTVTNGVLTDARYQLAASVILKHDLPWELEWQCEGDWRGALLSSDASQQTTGMHYLSRTRGGQLCFGTWTGSQYDNYGVDLSQLDSQAHTYRLVNRVAGDGSNMVWLYVDGDNMGPMNNYYVGSKAQNKTSDWVSGNDFVFACLGIEGHALSNLDLDHLAIWEAGAVAEPMTLRYDDHVDMTGKTVEIIDAGRPTSYQVGYGVEENQIPDTAVVTLEGSHLVAAGIGTALVRIDGQLYEITVEAAPISLLLLAGQSNMQGIDGEPAQSVICPTGQVYATYADRYKKTVEDVTKFAPSALSGSYSAVNVTGDVACLENYPVNMLTEAGDGREGMDSGLAYEWVRQTGEKVWVVNLGYGGSSINGWLEGGEHFNACLELLSACQETLRKEIAAGHFTLSHMGYFWCQGCADETQTAQWYVEKFQAMHRLFKTQLTFNHDSDAGTAEASMEFAAIIPIRAGHSWMSSYRAGTYPVSTNVPYYQSFLDLRFNGPRVAQYWMGNNPELTDIWNVCTIQEDWATLPDGTDGVAAYFRSAYPDGRVDYQPQVPQAASWYTPKTPADVHDNIHYNQIGYNELGRESARNALIMLGEREAPEAEATVEFKIWDGFTPAESIVANTVGNSGTLVVPMVSPVWKSKEVTYEVSDGLRYDYYDLLSDSIFTEGTLTSIGAEGTVSVIPRSLASYTWVFDGEKLVNTPEEGDSANPVTKLAGTLSNGQFRSARYQLSQGIYLLHDQAWSVEISLSNWSGASGSAVLSSGNDTTTGEPFFYFRPKDQFIGIGYYDGSQYRNHGVSLLKYGIDCKTGTHRYQFINHIAEDGSNMVWLYVDDTEIAPLTDLYQNSTYTASDVTWISGKDFVVPYFGTQNIPIDGCRVDSIRVMEANYDPDIHIHQWSGWETVAQAGPDGPGREERSCGGCGQTESREVNGVWQTHDLSTYLVQLPEVFCQDTNLWHKLPHNPYYYHSGTHWAKHESGKVSSVTIPVSGGEQIYATSFGKYPENGNSIGTGNGIRVTFFDKNGILKTMDPNQTYVEFAANGGYILAPEGAVAVNIPMYSNSDANALYIRNREHIYENGICAGCGKENINPERYRGKVISIMGDSISTFAGYIPVADGFNREHLARYPQSDLLTDVNETWWMQVVAGLDAKLGINESWRGSTLSGAVPVTTGDTGANAAMSNLTRIQNLGSNGTPDVILLYGGTNDLAHVSKVGTFDPATAPTEVNLTTKQWDNLADGFVHTLLRMRHFYPDALIVAMLPTYTKSYYSDTKLAQGNGVMAQICDHYGIPYVDLRDSGVTASHLPDGIHPGEEGMDLITDAVLELLLQRTDLQPGENVVHSVTHELRHVQGSQGHIKGISSGKAFAETLTGTNLSVTVTMGGVDITAQCYAGGKLSIPAVTGDLVITARGNYSLDDHLQPIPEGSYSDTNLWTLLEHDPQYYAADGWTVHSSGKVTSITIPVTAGDRIYASSFGAAGTNGSTTNGIRVTWFNEDGVLISMSADSVYKEFTQNGCLMAPAGATAVCIPMWTDSDAWEVYLLTLPERPVASVEITWGTMEFTYVDGAWNPDTHDYAEGSWVAEEEGNYVTVTNTGNVPVVVNYRYENAPGFDFVGSFTDGTQSLTTAQLPVGGKKTVWFLLSGRPKENLAEQIAGTVTVTLE